MEENIIIGPLTYARIDLDKWLWAIVYGYQDAQTFDIVLCAFDDNDLPNERTVRAMMRGIVEDRGWDICPDMVEV